MNDKIKNQLVKLAHEAGVEAKEINEEEAKCELRDGTIGLKPGCFSETDSKGDSHYYTIEDDLLEENIDITNLVINIKKLNALTIIKWCVVFFTVLTIIGLIGELIYVVRLADVFNAL